MLKQYIKNIAESRDIAILSSIIVVMLRIVSFLVADNCPIYDAGPLWNILNPFLSDRYVSFSASMFFVFGIAFYAMYLNNKHALIRGRTYLPFVFILFLFSLSKYMVFMTPSYIGVLIILYSIDQLFNAYQRPIASQEAFKVSFCITFGSLFVPGILIYLPIFFVGFSTMRCNGFRVFLAFIIGVSMVIWVTSLFSLMIGYDIEFLYSKLTSLYDKMKELSIFRIKISGIILFTVSIGTFIVVVMDNYVNSYKDKMRIRANYSFLNLIAFFSIIIYLFLTLHMQISLMVAFASTGFVLAHFFALADKKWKIVLGIALCVFYLGVYAHFLFNS